MFSLLFHLPQKKYTAKIQVIGAGLGALLDGEPIE